MPPRVLQYYIGIDLKTFRRYASMGKDIFPSKKTAEGARVASSAMPWIDGLLQQFKDLLLHGVGLGQGTDACLAQNLVLGQVGRGLTIVGGQDVVLR